MIPNFKLTLLVRKDESEQALASLSKALEHHDYTDYELAIVDVNEKPILARSLGVIHTPVIIRHVEKGKALYCQNLSDPAQIRKTLGFKPE